MKYLFLLKQYKKYYFYKNNSKYESCNKYLLKKN